MNIHVYVLYMRKKKYIYIVENSELVSRPNSGYGISISFFRQC